MEFWPISPKLAPHKTQNTIYHTAPQSLQENLRLTYIRPANSRVKWCTSLFKAASCSLSRFLGLSSSRRIGRLESDECDVGYDDDMNQNPIALQASTQLLTLDKSIGRTIPMGPTEWARLHQVIGRQCKNAAQNFVGALSISLYNSV